MTILAALGTLSYNGYVFDGTSQVSVNVEFVSDDSGRTVLYHRHTIRVKALVQGDAGTTAEMLNVRRLLGEQGRELIFIGRGFGNDLIVNSPGGAGVRDVKWGPIPRVLKWEPVASLNCGELEWEVTTCVAVCDHGVTRFTGLMSLNYEMDFAVNERGYTTRTISGHIEIAMTRLGRLVPDTADAYLNFYATDVPHGFKRTQTRRLSADKSRLEFSITDAEIESPNAFPPSVVDIQCRHRVGWKRGSGLVRNTITAEIEVAPTVSTAFALIVFSTIANQRLAIARAAAGRAASVIGGETGAVGMVLIDDFGIDEDVFSRRSSFTLGYRVPTSLAQFMFDCGLWSPLPTNWAAWHDSVALGQSQRGWAGMLHLPGNDLIRDLCVPPINVAVNTLQNQGQTQRPQLPNIRNQRPQAANSWLEYRNAIQTERDRATTRQRILQTPDIEQGTFNPSDTTGMFYPTKSGTDDIIQEGARSSYYVTIEGRAARAGYEIPRPRYDRIGTETATEVGGVFQQAVTGNWFGVPIYQARWSLEYAMPNSPGLVSLLQNPREFLNGDGTAIS